MANQGEIWTQAPCSRPTALITMLCYTLKELPPSVIPSKAVILNFYTPNECSPPLVTGGLVSPYCIRAKVIPIPLFRCSSFATEAHSTGVHWAIGEVWQNVALLALRGWYTNCPCWRAPTTSLKSKSNLYHFVSPAPSSQENSGQISFLKKWKRSVMEYHLFHYDLFVQGTQSALSQSNPAISTVGLDALLLRKEK